MKGLFFLFFLLLGVISKTWAFYSGVGIHYSNFSKADPNTLLDFLKIYKINSIRVDYSWKQVESAQGIYKPIKEIDTALNLMSKYGIRPVVILDYGNSLYGIDKPTKEDELQKFIKYSLWVARHLSKYNPIYEIWNEWNIQPPRNISLSAESAMQYISLVKSTSVEIKRAYPQTTIIAGSFNPIKSWQEKWISVVLNNGLLNYVDGISLHMYGFSKEKLISPVSNLSYVEQLEKKIQKISGTTYPIYITEVGVPSMYVNGIDDVDISAYAAEYLYYAESKNYIKGVWWYDLIDDGIIKSDPEDNFGILGYNLKPKVSLR
ncbi:cellulase family glycosylhydrolase [Klebsiella pneumoniae]|nr:cellulase family glycosylhydrolase [Klebsiella pneumoniae]